MIRIEEIEKRAAYLRDFIDENGHLWDDCQIEKMTFVAELIEELPEFVAASLALFCACYKIVEWDDGGDNPDLLATAIADARKALGKLAKDVELSNLFDG